MSKKIDELSNDDITVYKHKNGRLMVYIKEAKQVISYPRYIMSKELGRELSSDEQVHHKDGDFLNNNIDNLEVLTAEEHAAIHGEQHTKYYDRMMTCPWCGKEFLWTAHQQLKFYGNLNRKIPKTNNPLGVPFCSKSCAGKYGRSIQEKNETIPGRARRKLTDEDVRYIREHYIPYDKEFGGYALGRKFGVDKSTIQYVISGKTYKDV